MLLSLQKPHIVSTDMCFSTSTQALTLGPAPDAHDLTYYVRGLRLDIWDNMNFFQNIQKAYNETLHA